MMFTLEADAYRKPLLDNGYIHIKNGISDEFQRYLSQFYEESLRTCQNEREDVYVEGKKRQFIFDFPDDDAALEFRKKISALTGLNEDTFTISERHIKAYDERAKPYPAPHKDRNASSYSIGIPIFLAPGTSVCVFPGLGRSLNSSDSAVFRQDELGTGFEELYKSADAMLLWEEQKDMIVFEGSALYHERMKPGGTVILYLKVNDTGNDPLRENLPVFRAAPQRRTLRQASAVPSAAVSGRPGASSG